MEISNEWTAESTGQAGGVSGGESGEQSGESAAISSAESSGDGSGDGSGDDRVSLDWERSESDLVQVVSGDAAEESEAAEESSEDQETDSWGADNLISSGDLIYYVPSGSDAVTVANVPDYTNALIVVVLGLGLIAGILFGRLASWR